jgi:hypothetical protein
MAEAQAKSCIAREAFRSSVQCTYEQRELGRWNPPFEKVLFRQKTKKPLHKFLQINVFFGKLPNAQR